VLGGESEHGEIIRAWSAWGRHYHTLGHLEACLREIQLARELAQRPAEVEMALWFHDAIYRTYRKDNEARSAEWASQFLTRGGCEAASVTRVSDMVMATAHLGANFTGDTALTVDIDLSILGQPADVYDSFERNVRKEYWWVPKRRYCAARVKVLRSFLDREAIFQWPLFRERYESPARANLARAIQVLTPS
jgi:predicted metal-dependent HD superfamily phosphohydrolase